MNGWSYKLVLERFCLFFFKEFRSTLLNSFNYVFSLLILVSLESDKPNQV